MVRRHGAAYWDAVRDIRRVQEENARRHHRMVQTQRNMAKVAAGAAAASAAVAASSYATPKKTKKFRSKPSRLGYYSKTKGLTIHFEP